jgi:HAE1 family hydrophobic/amphiphilic exporter-1
LQPPIDAEGRPLASGTETARAARSALAFVATRPVAITMFMIALGVFGFVSFAKLPVDLLPDISYPTLTVRTMFPGAAPEDVEDRVSVRLQETLATLPKLIGTTSISRASTSDVVLEFDWGTNMTYAVQEVRDRIDGVFLPEEAERPLILRYDPNLDPILRFGVAPTTDGVEDEATLVRLRWLAEKRIKRDLEGIEGVAAVQVRGGLEEEIRVRVDPFRLAAQKLDPALIGQRLAQENLNASGGQIREGSTDYLVRTLNEFREVSEIEDLAVVRRGDAIVRVRDIADVTRTHAEREVVTKLDGRQAVEVAIYREAGANIVDVAARVRLALVGTPEGARLAAEKAAAGVRNDEVPFSERDKLDFLAWELRDEAQIEVLSDQSTFIADAVDEVKSSALLGGALAIAVVWMFLRRLAPTLIIGVSIPISVLVTFAPMFLLDVSLNIMSLGGLALGVGMLVDNAIVVLESITRCRDEGDDLRTAAVRGVSEVAGAIIASTLTTVCVFAPIVFVHGIAGQIFGDQAVTVVSALLVSLLVAVLFIPMLASRPAFSGDSGDSGPRKGLLPFLAPLWPRGLVWSWGAALPNVARYVWGVVLVLGAIVVWLALALTFVLGRLLYWALWPVRFVFDVTWRALDALYPPVLRFALSARVPLLLGIGALTWYSFTRIDELGLELLPEIHQGEFTAFLALPVGTPIEESELIYTELDEELRKFPEVAVTSLTVGVETDTLTREIEGEHTARLTARLAPESHSAAIEDDVIERLRALASRTPELEVVDVRRPTPFALDAPIAVEVKGYDLDLLGEAATEVARRLATIPGLTDIRSTIRPGYPEARVTFDRDKTLAYSLDLGAVSTFVRDQVLGNVSTRFVEGDDRIDVRVRGDEAILDSIAAISEIVVNPTGETPVPLRSVADITLAQGPAEIRRIGGQRAVLVTAASTGLDLGNVNKRIEAALATMQPPRDVEVSLGGQKRELDEGTASLRFALLLAIFLVYVVMASQFESLVQPFVILFSVPLASVGAVFLLHLSGLPLSVVVFIGFILLAGIVVNNAIVLVDRINAKRAAGLTVRDAILEAGRARLRPILMTTGTTVLGLVPMTGWLVNTPGLAQYLGGEGAELRAPMAITVIGGLTSSTLLTLIVIPVIYSLVVRDKRRAPPVATTFVTEGATS